MAARILLVFGFLLGATAVGAAGAPALTSYSDYRQAVAANDAAAYGQFRAGFIELKHRP